MNKITVVDWVASSLPIAGGLIPATMTFHNAQAQLGFGIPESFIIGAVVEALGFVTIKTSLDILAQNQNEHGKPFDSAFWLSLTGTLVYLVSVLMVNAILDDGDMWRKITLALLSLFGLIGGLMIALRDHLYKRQVALEDAQDRALRVAEDEKQRAAERETAEIEHAWQMDQERLRLEHEERMLKIEEESRRKIAKIEAGSIRKPSGVVTDGSGGPPDATDDHPETRLRWSDVSPEDYRWIVDAPVGEIVNRYKLTGKDPERLARTWKKYARNGQGKAGVQ